MDKKFKVLSIDGGGVKGVFVAKYLMIIESELKKRSNGNVSIRNHFDLITGTSTGGLMAIAISLGISAEEIHNLYIDSAKGIFGNKRNILRQFFDSSHSSKFLEKIIRDKFREYNKGKDPRLEDCKTDLCIPIYNLTTGEPSLLKTQNGKSSERDGQIPAFQVAMAAVAAPTYFNPYTGVYSDLKGNQKQISSIVDGGIVTKNPALIAFLEATKVFNQPTSNLEILSIGTGMRKLANETNNKRWGIHYWLFKDKRRRLFEMFTQGQSQQVIGYLNLMKKKVSKENSFVFDRVDTILRMEDDIAFDEYDNKKIIAFSNLASVEFEKSGKDTLFKHFYR